MLPPRISKLQIIFKKILTLISQDDLRDYTSSKISALRSQPVADPVIIDAYTGIPGGMVFSRKLDEFTVLRGSFNANSANRANFAKMFENSRGSLLRTIRVQKVLVFEKTMSSVTARGAVVGLHGIIEHPFLYFIHINKLWTSNFKHPFNRWATSPKPSADLWMVSVPGNNTRFCSAQQAQARRLPSRP